MIQGTASDVGKSVICTAICRILSNQKYAVTPFKSQNMSNNSYVTIDGKEIGRAQGVQAEAARVEASVYMNPILLKPQSDRVSEIVRLGQRYQSLSGKNYRREFYQTGIETITLALSQLEKEFDYIVIEGAGSPAEVNLNDREIVNMKVAELADVPVVLVSDIDRGGVFASIVGTLQLLPEHQRKRVKGLIINKFRGDESLFASGKEWLEQYTGIKVLGVIPHLHDITIEGEDSLSMYSHFQQGNSKIDIDIVVIDLPYVSNYTDLEPFRFEEDVQIRFVNRVEDLGQPDAIIIPGTKSTISDIKFLHERNVFDAIIKYANNGGTVLGLCGGYQMLGEVLIDQSGADTGTEGTTISGLGIAPLTTYFYDSKKTVRSEGVLADIPSRTISGYEIHLGQTISRDDSNQPFLFVEGEKEGISIDQGRIIGTYFHHLFHNDEWRTDWLNRLRLQKGVATKDVIWVEKQRDLSYERLAEKVKKALDIESLMTIIEEWERNGT